MSRQVTTRWPSASTVSVSSCSNSWRRSSSWGRKHTATPYWPAGGSSASITPRISSSGSCMQHARAVARVRVGAGRAPVLEVLQGGDRPPDRLVRGLAAQPRDERDAARVVLVLRVVQTDRLGRTRAMRQRTAPEGCGLGTGKRKGSSGRAGLRQRSVASRPPRSGRTVGGCGRRRTAGRWMRSALRSGATRHLRGDPPRGGATARHEGHRTTAMPARPTRGPATRGAADAARPRRARAARGPARIGCRPWP